MFDRILRRVSVVTGLVAVAALTSAFFPSAYIWTNGDIVLELQLGDLDAPLSDGATSWDEVVVTAIGMWNAELENVTLVPVLASDAPQADENGYNNIFFAAELYGDSLGGALAVTLSTYETGDYKTEADIAVNTDYTWDSYRGPWLRGDGDRKDLRRVILHETGHLLGLRHTEEDGQIVDAIMNAYAGDLDALQEDDIAGAHFLYDTAGNNGRIGNGDDHGGLLATATSLAIGQTLAGTLTGWDIDYFRIDLAVPGALTIETLGALDTYGTLFDAAGDMVAYDDQSGNGDNFRMVASATAAGAYYLKVEGFDGETAGDYQVTMSYNSDVTNGDTEADELESAAVIPLNGAVSGALNYNLDVDYFKIEIVQPGRLTVFTSGNLDTVGVLLTPDESVVDLDDNSGRDYNFHFQTRVLLPGTYYLGVSSLYGDYGEYEISSSFTVVEGEVSNAARLLNLSVLTGASGDFGTLIMGFATTGASKSLLLRAVGPSLASRDVVNYLYDPRMILYNTAATALDENDDWLLSDDYLQIATVADVVGAFELDQFYDAALLAEPEAGSYTVHVVDAIDEPGQVLVEAYDADGLGALGRLVNLSTRTQIGLNGSILTAGVVIGGEGTIKLLIRGVGPQLTEKGVPGALADPQIKLYGAGEVLLAENDNWGDAEGDIAGTAETVGAFPLDVGSTDASLVIELAAGSYTVRLSGVGGGIGQGLIELYEVR